MAYNAVPTVTTGDLWTASNHNTYIRDNFAAGVPDIFTTKGDLAVASGANAAVRLAVGSNNQVLMADSGKTAGVKWGTNFEILTTPLTNTSWDGDSKNSGSYVITATSFNAAIPANAKALLISVVVQFPATTYGRVYVNTYLKSHQCAVDIYSHSNYPDEADSGIVVLNEGKFEVSIMNQNLDNIYIYVLGYIL